jgi:NAD(P)-dependent dehydrogenase (short-subunit alcohol dehydrogenase family)
MRKAFIVGGTGQIGRAVAGTLAGAGWSPWSVERPLVLDMAAAAELGYRPVAAYPDAVEKVCHDLIARAEGRPWREAFPGLAPYPDAMFEYDREDAFLASTA